MEKHMTLDETPDAMLCDDCMHNGYDSEIQLFRCSDCHRNGCEHCIEERGKNGEIARCMLSGSCFRAMRGESMSVQDAVDDDFVDIEDRS